MDDQREPPPAVLSSQRVHDGWVGLRIDRLRFANGHESVQDVVEHRGGVTLVAIDGNNQILFVRQYRHPAEKDLLELPAGTSEPGEAPEVCAERELQEETGYKPGRLDKLGGFYLAPGYCSEYQHIFLATDLSESKLEGDEPAIHLERHSLRDALALVRDGHIEDAKTAAALLLYIELSASL
jgi:ADP-ribose pyrophosphatase